MQQVQLFACDSAHMHKEVGLLQQSSPIDAPATCPAPPMPVSLQ